MKLNRMVGYKDRQKPGENVKAPGLPHAPLNTVVPLAIKRNKDRTKGKVSLTSLFPRSTQQVQKVALQCIILGTQSNFLNSISIQFTLMKNEVVRKAI